MDEKIKLMHDDPDYKLFRAYEELLGRAAKAPGLSPRGAETYIAHTTHLIGRILEKHSDAFNHELKNSKYLFRVFLFFYNFLI